MSFRSLPYACLRRPRATSAAVAVALALLACQSPSPTSTSGAGGNDAEGQGVPGGSADANATTKPDGLAPGGTQPNQALVVPGTGGNVATSPNATPSPNGVVPANGNTPLPNGNDVAITKVAAIVNPNIGFDAVPRNDNKAVALTFDDGPDGPQGATTMVLDTLKKENLKATFFLCANIGFANLETDPTAQAQLKRIVADGHQVASHTYDHKDLATMSTAQVDQEFQKLNDIYQKVLGPTAPVMTLVRTPFGSPFQLDNPNTQRLASTITKYGVQVGWGMDPKDWTFDHYSKDSSVFNADVQDVINAVQKLIDNKQWGVILLHAVHLPSATALPTVIKMLRDNGYHFVSVEDVVRAQYGANSASIMAANKAAGLAK